MMFGSVAANNAWHRVGSFARAIVRRHFFCPVARYVDDFFGASREGVAMTGGVILSVILKLLGLQTDPAKDVDDTLQMVVLGSAVRIMLAARAVTTAIAEKKAVKWADLLMKAVQENRLEWDEAAKMADRLSAAVTAAHDKVGRAYIKPFFAQAYQPLPHMSATLIRASHWWAQYLTERPPSIHEACAHQLPTVLQALPGKRRQLHIFDAYMDVHRDAF